MGEIARPTLAIKACTCTLARLFRPGKAVSLEADKTKTTDCKANKAKSRYHKLDDLHASSLPDRTYTPRGAVDVPAAPSKLSWDSLDW